jgi:hypothetical protein
VLKPLSKVSLEIPFDAAEHIKSLSEFCNLYRNHGWMRLIILDSIPHPDYIHIMGLYRFNGEFIRKHVSEVEKM